jgi:hypothetical protein
LFQNGKDARHGAVNFSCNLADTKTDAKRVKKGMNWLWRLGLITQKIRHIGFANAGNLARFRPQPPLSIF